MINSLFLDPIHPEFNLVKAMFAHGLIRCPYERVIVQLYHVIQWWTAGIKNLPSLMNKIDEHLAFDDGKLIGPISPLVLFSRSAFVQVFAF